MLSISILETSFIIKLLRHYYKNFNKRLIKSPKLYFLDSGLLCYLVLIKNSNLLKSKGLCKIINSFIIVILL
ncbi:MAG: DUF4143 domain-containing protein [Anaerohalosphaeraceae bacterium]|nr:DUF4143 domain-containing protein [Anaerohalosphaeraceae bacterium]